MCIRDRYTNVFYKLGIDFAVVNSLDSYDEISLTDEFKVMTLSLTPSLKGRKTSCYIKFCVRLVFVFFPIGIYAVSYTHLDVYKRQVQNG